MGAARYIGVDALKKRGHYPSAAFRGYKMDAWEGGHRARFVVRRPGAVAPGGVTSRLAQWADAFATVAEIIGVPLPPEVAEDSVILLPLLRGVDRPVRDHAVNQSYRGVLALLQGPWKLIYGRGSDNANHTTDPAPARLYNLEDDASETKNLMALQPAIGGRMDRLMGKIVSEGRSTPGLPQPNVRAPTFAFSLQLLMPSAPNESYQSPF
jgi:arylsulfatase A-like enzyme